jgi:hypothetical protein
MKAHVGYIVHVLGALVLVCLPLHGSDAAPLGTGFTYQGQVQIGGTPADGTCDFVFSLWDAAGSGTPPTGGTQMGSSQTIDGVGVADGLFTVVLNDSAQFGAGAFTGEDVYLQIAVSCPAGGSPLTLSPRQRLTAAPYALYAPSAGSADDLSCSGCVASSDLAANAVSTAQLGDNQVTTAKIGNAQITSAKIFDGTIESADLAPSARGWGLSGNAGTSSSNFLGTTDNQAFDLRVNGARALRLEPADGSVNVIGGRLNMVAPGVGEAFIGGGGHNSVTNNTSVVVGGRNNVVSGEFAGVVGGSDNTAMGDLAMIGGGRENGASGEWSTVAGGDTNLASADHATVSGGGRTDLDDPATGNRATDTYATVGGGGDNQAGNADGDPTNADSATVCGGQHNTASANGSTVGGGGQNEASTSFSTVAGGFANQASGSGSTIAGGLANTASGFSSTSPGGRQNVAAADYSFAAGRRAKANHVGPCRLLRVGRFHRCRLRIGGGRHLQHPRYQGATARQERRRRQHRDGGGSVLQRQRHRRLGQHQRRRHHQSQVRRRRSDTHGHRPVFDHHRPLRRE